jgi:hypothetical protein
MKPSRRIMLKYIAATAALPLTGNALAQSKASKQAMKYQDQPKDGQRCDQCLQFIAPAKKGAQGTCKVVEGPINPAGWCIAYVKKS